MQVRQRFHRNRRRYISRNSFGLVQEAVLRNKREGATSTSDLRQELTEGLVDWVDREVLNELLKDATLAVMIKELRASGIHPAEI